MRRGKYRRKSVRYYSKRKRRVKSKYHQKRISVRSVRNSRNGIHL